jgi:hypothetical protein
MFSVLMKTIIAAKAMRNTADVTGGNPIAVSSVYLSVTAGNICKKPQSNILLKTSY